MRRSSFIAIPQAPSTGTDAPPPREGCVRIDTDQDDLAWPDMPQPYGRLPSPETIHWVRGASSLAIGKFEGYVYFENTPAKYDQYLLLSQVTGTYVDGEDLERGTSSTGPWESVGILADTPVDQVVADCDTGCFGDECDPGSTGDGPDWKTDPDADPKFRPDTPGAIAQFGIDRPFGPWTDRYSYKTTIASGGSPPFTEGKVTGQITGSIAEISHFVDPGGGDNLVIHVEGITLGKNATRFLHGEVLDHVDSTGQITLANPMKETGPFTLGEQGGPPV
jgi:hypothetical protein